MFSFLTKKITKIFEKISDQGCLSEKNIKITLKKIRYTLLDADVTLQVANQLVNSIQHQKIRDAINNSVTPGKTFIKIIQKELIEILGKKKIEIKLNKNNLNILLLVGLQGSGKTTSAAKIAKFLLQKKYKVLVTSLDIYRPAAIKQMQLLTHQTNANFYIPKKNDSTLEIAKKVKEYAIKNLYNVLIIDTSGRLHINMYMMKELQKIQELLQPTETIFVVDSMIGQDAIFSIKKFNEFLKISSVFLTKMDSDHRGGVAVSIKYLTGIPIKFLGTGEKLNDFTKFYPDRIAKRILGMGDVVTLIEDINKNLNSTERENIKKNFKKGNEYNLQDFLQHIRQIQKIGGISSILSKLPAYSIQKDPKILLLNKYNLKKIEYMINSMTHEEQKNPKILKKSRKKRISLGSGITIQEINQYLKQFENIKNIMKKIKNKNFKNVFKNFNDNFIK